MEKVETTEERIRKLSEKLISGANAEQEVLALQRILICLVEMMGGSVFIHEYEYTKYLLDTYPTTLETTRMIDPPGIQLKVKHE